MLEKAAEKVGKDDLACCNLYLSMLQALGIETEKFSDSTGTLEGFFV